MCYGRNVTLAGNCLVGHKWMWNTCVTKGALQVNDVYFFMILMCKAYYFASLSFSKMIG